MNDEQVVETIEDDDFADLLKDNDEDNDATVIDDDPSLIVIPDEEVMLTTLDNPFNPKEQYTAWRLWDIEHGYRTEELIDRLSADFPVNTVDSYSLTKLRLDMLLSIAEDDPLQNYKLT